MTIKQHRRIEDKVISIAAFILISAIFGTIALFIYVLVCATMAL